MRVNNDLTKRRLVLLTSARNEIKAQLSRKFSEDEIKELDDEHNVFAYANINSDLCMRVRGRIMRFNTLTELNETLKQAFPEE